MCNDPHVTKNVPNSMIDRSACPAMARMVEGNQATPLVVDWVGWLA
jgi:hypothetical protein